MYNLLYGLSRKFALLVLVTSLLFSGLGLSDSAQARGFGAEGDAAEFVSQSANLVLATGQNFSVYFTLANIGTTTWVPGQYWLQNQAWPMGAATEQPIAFDVPPEGSHTWSINMIAPDTPGVYQTTWMIYHSGDAAPFGPSMQITVTVLEPNVRVRIGGLSMSKYLLRPKKLKQVSFVGVNNGIVLVQSLDGLKLLASEQEVLMQGLVKTGFSQLMGLPASQLSTKYYFPVYDDTIANEQIVFANAGAANTRVKVTIGGVERGRYTLAPNQFKRVRYAGLKGNPVIVQSLDGVPIIAALRDMLYDSGNPTSYAEMMGLPVNQLSSTYYFPAYNNVDVEEQLLITNVSTVDTHVTVTIAGVRKNTYLVHPGELKRLSYAGVKDGPVVVQSVEGAKIIAAERDLLRNGIIRESYAQLMGRPASQITTKYYFTRYNNKTVAEQLLIANVGTTPTNVTITIGGIPKGTYAINPNRLLRKSFFNLSSGLVVIQSSGGVKIVVAQQDFLKDGTTPKSFSQIMGLPAAQLSLKFYFPAYDSVNVNESINMNRP